MFFVEADTATVVQSFLNTDMLIPVLAITLGCAIGALSIVCGVIKSVATSRHREHSRRELAAYVAEGTLDPDKAIAMMEAGKSSRGCRS